MFFIFTTLYFVISVYHFFSIFLKCSKIYEHGENLEQFLKILQWEVPLMPSISQPLFLLGSSRNIPYF